MLGVAVLMALVISQPTVPIYDGTPMLLLQTSQQGIWYVVGREGTQVHQDGLLLGDPTSGYVIYPMNQPLDYRDRMYAVVNSTGPQVAP